MTANIVHQYKILKADAVKRGLHELNYVWVIQEISENHDIDWDTVKKRLSKYFENSKTDELRGAKIVF